MSDAPGGPGIAPTWTSSAKDLVTTALDGQSRVWLTLGYGITNEIYWPSTGQPQLRDMGFIVATADGWVEVKRAADYRLETPAPGVLVPTVVHQGQGWELRLEWVVDPNRDTVLIRHRLTGDAEGLYALVAPHLGAGGHTNTAWVDGRGLHAVADGATAALSVAGSAAFGRVSAGFVGSSDGWQDFNDNGQMTWSYDRAANGNVALTAAIEPIGVLAVGFAGTVEGARVLARSSLAEGFDTVRGRFVDGWERYVAGLDLPPVDPRWQPMVERSAAVLACHEDRSFPGASVASLSVPWGNGRADLGGYHLVWVRDAVECALGRLAVGDRAAARRTLEWLCATQQPDGHWTQNSFPDGRPFWSGVQLDEVALPVILAAALGIAPDDAPVAAMVRAAVAYLADNGPASPQDRWEEDAGTNAFTLAVIIAALVSASPWLDDATSRYCNDLADYWNARIEDWLYTSDGTLARGRGIGGYYVRLGRADELLDSCGRVDVRNRADLSVAPAELVACDFLALVRFGLRAADDQRIVDTVSVIDDVLAVELPTGVAYRRYNGDGYGEQADGSAFDGVGIGRPWPLLTGERGTYEIQRGASADRFLSSMIAMSGPGLLLPEQVWDSEPIPERQLEPGRPTGSAMPLAWAHAEFVKLATHAARRGPIEQIPAVASRYRGAMPPQRWYWRVDAPFETMPESTDLVVDHRFPFVLHGPGGALASHSGPLGRSLLALDASLLPVDADMRSPSGEPIATVRVRRR